MVWQRHMTPKKQPTARIDLPYKSIPVRIRPAPIRGSHAPEIYPFYIYRSSPGNRAHGSVAQSAEQGLLSFHRIRVQAPADPLPCTGKKYLVRVAPVSQPDQAGNIITPVTHFWSQGALKRLSDIILHMGRPLPYQPWDGTGTGAGRTTCENTKRKDVEA